LCMLCGQFVDNGCIRSHIKDIVLYILKDAVLKALVFCFPVRLESFFAEAKVRIEVYGGVQGVFSGIL